MKKAILFLAGLLACNISSFSESNNYLDGNGTVVETMTVTSETWTVRKHIQRVQIGDLAQERSLQIYSEHSDRSRVIGRLKVGDFVNISRVAEAITKDEYSVWLQIATDKNISGWIFFGSYSNEYAQFSDPYYHNRWEVIGYFKASKSWTIRRMFYQHVAVWEVLNIRDKPSLKDTKVISKIVPPENGNPQVNLDVTEATEETETIDGRNDRWLKISYHGIEGWIFGGYVDVARGGPKYFTPESIIYFGLGSY